VNVAHFPTLRLSDASAALGLATSPGAAPDVGKILRISYIGLGLFILIFSVWAALAPMSSAAIAPGLLRADGGGRKTVQHLEGGIIKAIHVRDGDRVTASQPLLTIDGTQSDARDAALQSTYDALLAQDARLTAEREGLPAINYPSSLMNRIGHRKVAEIISGSNAVFQARRTALAAQITILEQRLGQATAEIESYRSQLLALTDQERLLDEEVTSITGLVEEGLERKSRLLALQRQQSNVAGQRGQLEASIARVGQAMAETRAQMAFLRRQQLAEVAGQQRDAQMQMAELQEKLTSSRDVSRRRQVVAPVEGTVVSLRKVTIGGVVTPGEPILDIVPAKEQIVIHARLNPNDIDVVFPGLRAEVRLTPYKARVLPLLKGQVRRVSADALTLDATDALYYEAEIVLDADGLKHLKDVRLVSGMPAEVFITLGQRSLLQYLTQPIVDSFHRAWREP
jgi:HlyD family secretion protein